MALNFSLNNTNLGIFQDIPKFEDSYSKENSKNKKILRIRMLVNIGPYPSDGRE